MSARTLIKVAGALAVVLVIAAFGYKKMYADKRADLVKQLDKVNGENAQYEEANLRIVPARQEIKDLAGDAIGGSIDEADHVLRTALAALAAEAGVQDPTISSERPRPVMNPYINSRGTNRTIRDLLKKRADFAIIKAGISASGSLEQTLQLVALAQSQPWLHRVVHVSLKPANKERTVFDINIRTQSLYMPDVHRESQALVLAPMDPLAIDRITPIAMKNVFRFIPDAPRPPDPVVVVIDDTPKPTPPPPYHEWRVAGMAMGTNGIEVWIINSRTREWRTMTRGQSVLAARFLDAQPQQERAVFEIEGKLYEFFTNSVLTERAAIPESDRPT